jgi:hypothetical protein
MSATLPGSEARRQLTGECRTRGACSPSGWTYLQNLLYSQLWKAGSWLFALWVAWELEMSDLTAGHTHKEGQNLTSPLPQRQRYKNYGWILLYSQPQWNNNYVGYQLLWLNAQPFSSTLSLNPLNNAMRLVLFLVLPYKQGNWGLRMLSKWLKNT